MVWVKLLALWVDHVELVALKDVVQQFVRPVKTPKQAEYSRGVVGPKSMAEERFKETNWKLGQVFEK